MTYFAEPATPSADAMNLLPSRTANETRTADTSPHQPLRDQSPASEHELNQEVPAAAAS
ncbi:hypothetical protein [Arthrobacter sp. Y81]|uniref:hypothetical protein n=1 Tax=Arthrobacter sp. Y81 TaxID=2058897 RepID=UPI0015E3D50D|nr:hypothetical protein [Arthrobacter sp. Y81]